MSATMNLKNADTFFFIYIDSSNYFA